MTVEAIERVPATEAMTVRDLVVRRAALGDKPFLHVDDRMITYAEVDLQSTRIANRLAELGVERGDRVATFMYNSVEHVLLWFACAKLGAIWSPLNIALVGEDLAWTLNSTGARVAILDEDAAEAFAAVRGQLDLVDVVVLRGDAAAARRMEMLPFEELLDGGDELPDVEVLPSSPAAITYTGGSTGRPKGVLLPHFCLIGAGLRYREIASATADDVGFSFGQLFHAAGQQTGVLGPMLAGMTAVLSRWFSASRYWEVVREHSVTIIDPITPLMMALLKQPPSDEDREHSVRIAVGSGTAQMPRADRDEFERRFAVTLHEGYAQTETGVMAFSERPGDRRDGSAGRSHGWFEASIRDGDDVEVPPGVTGEIALRPLRPHVFMLGYHGAGDTTVGTWRNLWHHTGDLGRMDEDGYLYFEGRQAHWMRVRGENVSAYEVESVIRAVDGVEEVVVVGVPGAMGDEELKAYVRMADDDSPFDPASIVAACERDLARFKVPRYFERVSDFPRSAAKGEIERAKLRSLGTDGEWDRETDR